MTPALSTAKVQRKKMQTSGQLSLYVIAPLGRKWRKEGNQANAARKGQKGAPDFSGVVTVQVLPQVTNIGH